MKLFDYIVTKVYILQICYYYCYYYLLFIFSRCCFILITIYYLFCPA